MTDAPTAVEPANQPDPHGPAPAPRRRGRGGLWITLGTAAVVLLAAVAHQFVSAWLYDETAPRWAAVIDDERSAYEGLRHQADRSGASVTRATDLSAVLTPEFVSTERSEELIANADGLSAEIEHAFAAPAPAEVEVSLAAFSPAWDRYFAVATMAALAPERIESARALDAARDELVAASKAADSSIAAVFDDAYAAAEAQLAASSSATYRRQIDVRWLLDQSGSVAPRGAGDYDTLVRAVAEVRASHEAAESRRADPGQAVRVEIEDFARSISHGVSLDFEWAYEVAGVSSDGWLAGTAQFWESDGGWGHITLSDSVADTWDDINARALVAHEVGHTQVVRDVCAAIFESPVFGSDHEVWATAWSIGMGYDVPGSGIEAYGRPSAEQIAASQGCR